MRRRGGEGEEEGRRGKQLSTVDLICTSPQACVTLYVHLFALHTHVLHYTDIRTYIHTNIKWKPILWTYRRMYVSKFTLRT